MAKICMNYSVYEEIVNAAREINRRTDNDNIHDKKKKFLERKEIPTIQELEAHHIRKNFATYFPYIVYYAEDGLCRIPDTDPNAKELNERLSTTRKYLKNLIAEYVEFENDVDDFEEG